MKSLRFIALAVSAGLALAFQWSNTGNIGIELLAPILLGNLVAGLFPERNFHTRAGLLFSVFAGVLLVRIYVMTEVDPVLRPTAA